MFESTPDLQWTICVLILFQIPIEGSTAMSPAPPFEGTKKPCRPFPATWLAWNTGIHKLVPSKRFLSESWTFRLLHTLTCFHCTDPRKHEGIEAWAKRDLTVVVPHHHCHHHRCQQGWMLTPGNPKSNHHHSCQNHCCNQMTLGFLVAHIVSLTHYSAV